MKQRRLSSKFALGKCQVKSNPLEGFPISELPDGILSHILSHLPMKEAARSSLVSARWKELWTYTTGSLDFDGSKVLKEVYNKPSYELLDKERSNYVSWVNHVLNSHKGTTIDELIVRFDLDYTFTSDIDNWVRFATQKQVKRFVLDFTQLFQRVSEGHYILPHRLLNFSRLKSLTAICFSTVDVTDECLESFMSNCPLLEEVCLDSLTGLINLKAYGQSLKHLKIAYCWGLESIEISAINLLSLECGGSGISLCFKSPCNLSKLHLMTPPLAQCMIRQLSNYISQLHTLVLRLSNEEFRSFPRFPELRTLKQLTLELSLFSISSFLPCISLIEASPCLYKFSFVVTFWHPHLGNAVQTATKGLLHKCLKVIEFVGFVGSDLDFELVFYLLDNVASLEKITVDTRKFHVQMAQEIIALELQTRLPPGAELIVL